VQGTPCSKNALALHDAGIALLKRNPLLKNLRSIPQWPVRLEEAGVADVQLT
jgi:hypothetical protein